MSKLRFHCMGRWTAGQVRVQWQASTRELIPQIEAGIARAWQEALDAGKKLFDGPMCRLEDFTTDENLTLKISPTSYRIFIGTNLCRANWPKENPRRVLANALGLSAALETSDGFFMLGRRNASVAFYPQRVHPFAGTVEAAENLDLFAEAHRELAEELHFTEADVTELAVMGIAADLSIAQPELIFHARTRRTRREVEATLDDAEHSGARAIEISKEKMSDAVNDGELTPIAVAAVLLLGRAHFGQDWFDHGVTPLRNTKK